MIVRYQVMDPTGNLTLLVTSPVPPEQRAAAAAQLMAAEPTAEQVGFLSQDGLRLEMAGGEFCGNASMCAAVLAGERAGRTGLIPLTVSGATDPVTVRVQPPQGGLYTCAVTMPQALEISTCTLRHGSARYRLPAVEFGGMTHLICTYGIVRTQAEEALPRWCKKLGACALGLMLLDLEAGRLDPLVYVPGAGTLVWENSCASGTTAVGLWLAAERQAPVHLALTEPAGTLTVDAEPDGRATLTGLVRCGAKKQIELN